MSLGQAQRKATKQELSLSERLEDRREEIERAILTRVYSVSDPGEEGSFEYVAGLRAAVSAATELGLAAIASGEKRERPIPLAVLTQARHAARQGVSLDTVLRRYFAGYTLLGEFIMQEAGAAGELTVEEIHRLSRSQAALFDRLVVAVTEEYTREHFPQARSTEHLQADRVKRLLAGELLDAADLDYELGSRWHLGAVGSGPGSAQALRALAAALDRRLLLACPRRGEAWAWLGGARPLSAELALRHAERFCPEEAAIALGEPGHGIAGWRLSHRQALAALPIGIRSGRRIARYADVALLSSVLRDEVLVDSLNEIFLAPLESDRDGGQSARETLRAYFRAGRNASSAAADLRVTRQTVKRRLQGIEERIGRPLDACAAEVDVALRLRDLGHGRDSRVVPVVTRNESHRSSVVVSEGGD